MACYDGKDYRDAEEIRASGVIQAGYYRKAQAAIVAILNANDLVSNYSKQHAIADDAMHNAETQQKHLRNVFWPKELDFLHEFGSEQDLETIEVKGRRHAGRLVSTVAGAFAEEMRKMDCNSSRYCTSDRSKRVQDLLITRSQAVANARVLGRIMGFIEVQQKRDRNFKRRMQATAMGRGLMQTAASLREGASGGLEEVGQMLSGQLNSALESFGFGRAMVQGGQTRMSQLEAWHPGNNQPQGGAPSTNPVDRANSLRNSGSMGSTIPDTEIGLVERDASGLPVGITNDMLQGLGDDNLTFGETDADIKNGMGDFSNLMESSPTTFLPMEIERPNDGRIGNRDLARGGSHTYTTHGYHGTPIRIKVKMSDFGLEWVDDKKQGDS